MLGPGSSAAFTVAAIAGLPGWASLFWQGLPGNSAPDAPGGGGEEPPEACECPEEAPPAEEVVCPRPECPEAECPACPEAECAVNEYPLREGGQTFLIAALPIALLAGVGLGRASYRTKPEKVEAVRVPVEEVLVTPRRRRVAAEQVAAVRARRETRLES